MSNLLKAFADRVASVPRFFRGNEEQATTPPRPGFSHSDGSHSSSQQNLSRRPDTPSQLLPSASTPVLSSSSLPATAAAAPATPVALPPDVIAMKQRLELMWSHFLRENDEEMRNMQFPLLLAAFLKLFHRTARFSPALFPSSLEFAFFVARRFFELLGAPLKTQPACAYEQHGGCDPFLGFLRSSTSQEFVEALSLLSTDEVSRDAICQTSLGSLMVSSLPRLLEVMCGEEDEAVVAGYLALLERLCGSVACLEDFMRNDSVYAIFQYLLLPFPSKLFLLKLLLALFQSQMNALLIDYLSDKHLIQELLNRIANFSLPPSEIVSYCVAIGSWLALSARLGQKLLDDFSEARGYEVYFQCLMWLDQHDREQSASDALLETITELCYVGFLPIEESHLVNSPFYSPVQSPVGSTSEQNSVRNLAAFQIFQTYFLKSARDDRKSRVLDCILGVYAANYRNFMLLQQLHTLAHFFESFRTSCSLEIQEGVLRVLMFVVTVVNCIPFVELSALSLILQDDPPIETTLLIVDTVSKIIYYDAKYKTILQEAGMLLILLSLLRSHHQQLMPADVALSLTEMNTLCLAPQVLPTFQAVLSCLTSLVEGCRENAPHLRTPEVTLMIFSFSICAPRIRAYSLPLLQQIILLDTNRDFGDLTTLLEFLLILPPPLLDVKIDFVRLVCRIFITVPDAKDAFREAGGFMNLVTLLSQLPASDCHVDIKVQLVEALLVCLTLSISENDKNRHSFKDYVLFPLAEALHLSQIFQACSLRQEVQILNGLFSIATESIISRSFPFLHQEMHPTVATPKLPRRTSTLSPSVPRAGAGGAADEPTGSETLHFENFRFDFTKPIHVPEVFPVIVYLRSLSIKSAQAKLHAKEILDLFLLSCSTHSANNGAGVISFITRNFGALICNPASIETPEVSSQLLRIVEVLGIQMVSAAELRQLLQLFQQASHNAVRETLLESLLRMSSSAAQSIPVLDINLSQRGYAFINIPALSLDDWPPPNGYSFMCWLNISKFDPTDTQGIPLFCLQSDDRKCYQRIAIDNRSQKLTLLTHSPEHGSAHRDGRKGPASTGLFSALSNSLSTLSSVATSVAANAASITPLSPPRGSSTSSSGDPSRAESSPSFDFVFCAERWYHVGIVHHKNRFQSSEARLYINGEFNSSLKSMYPNPSTGNVHNCTIGTINTQTHPSSQAWLLGPTYLTQEPLQPSSVFSVYLLGPHYFGNFQGSFSQYQTYSIFSSRNLAIARALSSSAPLSFFDFGAPNLSIAESSLVFALSPHNHFPLDLEKYANPLSELDTISLVNAADATNGTLMFLDGGIKARTPQTVPLILQEIGGISILLHLVEQSDSTKSLNLSIELLLAAYEATWMNVRDFEACDGYELLAFLLKRKSALLDACTLELMYNFAGLQVTQPGDTITGTLANPAAFKALLLDFGVWRRASAQLKLYYFVLMLNLVGELPTSQHTVDAESDLTFNCQRLLSIDLLQWILLRLLDPDVPRDVFSLIPQIISNLLRDNFSIEHVQTLANFLIVTLPVSDQDVTEPPHMPSAAVAADLNSGTQFGFLCRIIDARNLILKAVVTMINPVTIRVFTEVLNPKWTLHFFMTNMNEDTIFLTLKIMSILYQVSSSAFAIDWRLVHGWRLLELNLPHYFRSEKIYLLLLSLLVGRSVTEAFDEHMPFDLPNLCAHFQPSKQLLQNPHVLSVILRMLKAGCQALCSAQDPNDHPLEPPIEEDPASSQITRREDHDDDPASDILFNHPHSNNTEPSIREPSFNCTHDLEPASDASLPKLNDRLLAVQHALIGYLIHLFPLSTDLHYAFHHQDGSLVRSLVQLLYPHGALWYKIEPLVFAPTAAALTLRAGQSESLRTTVCTGVAFATSQLVFDLLRIILHTALVHSKTAISTLELTLESVMISADFFQSKILFDLIVFYSSQRLTSQFLANGSWLANIGKFANLLVDKVEQEVFLNGEITSFHFMIHLLQGVVEGVELSSSSEVAALKTQSVLIYRALNRLVLRLADRSAFGIVREPEAFLLTLNQIINHQSIIFSTLNTDPEFVACLCHLLFKLAVDDNRNIRVTGMNIWKLLLLTKPAQMDQLLIQRVVHQQSEDSSEPVVIDLKTDGFDMMLRMDYNVFFNWLTNSLPTIRLVFDITLTPVWVSYYASYQANKTSQSKHFRERQLYWQKHVERRTQKHQQLKSQQYLNRYKTLAHHNAKDSVQHQLLRTQQQEFARYDAMSSQWQHTRQDFSHERAVWGSPRSAHIAKWKLSGSEGPFRMQKLFEPNHSFFFDYPPENQLQQNPQMSTPDSPFSQPQFSERRMIPTSLDSYEFLQIRSLCASDLNPAPGAAAGSARSISPIFSPLELQSFPDQPRMLPELPMELPNLGSDSQDDEDLSFSGSDLSEVDPSDEFLDSLDQQQQGGDQGESSSSLPSSSSGWQLQPSSSSERLAVEDELQSPTTKSFLSGQLEENISSALLPQAYTQHQRNQHKIRLLIQTDPGDKIGSIFNAGIIDGMDRYNGLFLLSRYRCSFLPSYTINSIGEIVEEVAAADSPTASPHTGNGQSQHWMFSDIVSVQPRLYLLQRIAIELFMSTAETAFLVFDSSSYPIVLKQLTASLRGGGAGAESLLLGGAGLGIVWLSEIELGIRKSLALRARLPGFTNSGAGASLLNVPGVAVMTQRWQDGSISNFHYLMYLNTLASRSYNDLSQYPVFPWVLADYDSRTLDLESPTTFRDLSRPMGALCEPRATAFRTRYESWEPVENDSVPKFHYGCHYSSAGIVLHFLYRIEPFTRQFLKLMGGQFDHPDRLFHSLSETYQNAAGVQATGSNMADVKESIPALYYLPEMFSNQNRFDFGARQSGEVIFDTVLPPWAYSDPFEFVMRHRQALESDYVSQHLHLWIDLVFGARQRGVEAEKAQNVFYYLTYEGAIDIDSIRDPTERSAVIAQINNFGQTPLQLFDKPHPQRQVLPSQRRAEMPTLFVNEQGDVECKSFLEMSVGKPVGTLVLANEVVHAFALSRKPIPPLFARYISWGYPDRSLRVYSVADHDRPICVVEAPHGIHHISAVALSSDGRYLAVGGYDSVVTLFQIESDELNQLALAGSEYTPSLTARRPGIRIKMVKKLFGHAGPVSSLFISSAWNIIVSGSLDRTCIVWHLRSLSYVRQLTANLNTYVSHIQVNEASGEIVVASGVILNVWTLNGHLLATKNLQDPITALAIAHREDHEDHLKLYITGHQSGYIRACRVASYVTSTGPPPPVTPIEGRAKPFASFVPHSATFCTPPGSKTSSPSISPASPCFVPPTSPVGSPPERLSSMLPASARATPSTTSSPPSSSGPPSLRSEDEDSIGHFSDDELDQSASISSQSSPLKPAPSSPKIPPSSPQEPSPVPEPVADAEPRFSLIRELAVITQLHAHPAPLSALYLKSDSTLLYSADIKGTVVRHERNFVSPRDPDFPTTTP